ncbi:MAG: hypothetical protein K2F89_06965 [Treponemataceae bacterium]|nr:hypothetical protein [Treponemataceae bacterium]
MKKMFGMKAALVLALVGGGIIASCSNGSDGGENPAVGGEIVARMTTVNSELTFYTNGTVEFKEENAATKSVSGRAVTANAATSSGTYSGEVTKDGAKIDLSFTEGKRKDSSGTATIAERDDASNISVNMGGEKLELERIQTLVTAWHTTSGKTIYFYNDDRAMQVIKADENITCHPLVWKTDANGTVQLALLDSGNQSTRSNDGPVYEDATISGNTMTYAKETYTKIDDDRTLVTAWRATTKNKAGKPFLETMYFYSDKTFMIVMNKKEEGDDRITNGFAGTYEGVTTKNGETVYATIAKFAALGALPGTIEDNKLKINAPMNITYNRID